MVKENNFMKAAMACARRARAHDDVPVGAVIVRGGVIVARGENRVQMRSDPTLHAEIVAVRAAVRKLGCKFLDGCDIYVTLEPCAMCAAAIAFARMGRIVFAAADAKGGGIFHNARVYDADRHLWKPEVIRDETFADESAAMLRDFFKSKRKK
jgi:tRNA(adenine34) deaminase